MNLMTMFHLNAHTIPKAKIRAAFYHCDEVTHGNPAIFQNQDALKRLNGEY